MARRRLVTEMGRGTDLRGRDYTKAAVRALQDALHRNSLTVVPALGYPREAMEVEIVVGVARPGEVDRDAVAAVLPYGRADVTVVHGGLDIAADEGDGVTVVANAAAVVWLDVEEEGGDASANDDGSALGTRAGAGASDGMSSLPGDEGAANRGREGDAIPAGAGSTDADREDPPPAVTPGSRRIILETGTGADLHGENATKAARRAVRDALYHSSLALFGSLGIEPATMSVEIRIGVQRPDEVDADAVASEIPYGDVIVRLERGGLDVVYADKGTRIVVATAAVIARLPLPEGKFTLRG